MVFHRLIVRSKIVNVAEIDVEKVRGGINTPGVAMKRVVHLGDIFGALLAKCQCWQENTVL